jgi:hypothetical protein
MFLSLMRSLRGDALFVPAALRFTLARFPSLAVIFDRG